MTQKTPTTFVWDGREFELSRYDHQRQKLYNAERQAFGTQLFESTNRIGLVGNGKFKAAVEFVRRIEESATWIKIHRHQGRYVAPNRS